MMWEILLAVTSGKMMMVSEVVIMGVVQSRLDNKGLNKVSRDLKNKNVKFLESNLTFEIITLKLAAVQFQ